MKGSRFRIGCIAVVVLFCFSCHRNTESNKGVASANVNFDTLNVNSGLLKFKSYSFVDSAISKNKFLSCMLPADWDINYYTRYVPEDKEFPFRYGIVAIDTDGIQRFELFPLFSFVSASNAVLASRDSIAANRNKVMNVGAVSATAMDAIKDFIIPYCRQELGQDYHIVDEKPLNNLNQVLQNSDYQSAAGAVKIEYTRANRIYEEVIFATLQKKYVSINGYDSKCLWHINYACSFRTLKGQLNDEMGVLQTIFGSFRYNSDWTFKYNYILQFVKSTDEKTSSDKIAELYQSVPMAQKNADLLPGENMEKEMTKTYDIYTIYNINVEAYVNSTGDVIRLPKGYSVAWRSHEGDFLVSEDVGFIPKVVNKSDWLQLKKNESIIGENYLMGCNGL